MRTKGKERGASFCAGWTVKGGAMQCACGCFLWRDHEKSLCGGGRGSCCVSVAEAGRTRIVIRVADVVPELFGAASAVDEDVVGVLGASA